MSTTVFRNAPLFDGSAHRGRVGDVVARRSGGSPRSGDDVAPVGARVVDCDGGLLLPGFTDAHVHPVQGGLERLACDLSELPADRDAYLRHIADHARAHPDLEWIQGGGWAMAAFPGGLPTAAELDEAVPGRAIALANRDHHGMWVSSRAMELAGIGASTDDPVDGHLERDESGAPTGMLHEGAMALLSDVLPEADDDAMYAALLEGQSYLHSLGITSWQDAIVGAYANMRDAGPTYARAAGRGDLLSSVVGALWWERDRGEEQVPELVAKRGDWSSGRFAATAVKVMQDGVAENGTAALVEPYLDRCGHATTNSGLSFVDPQALRRHVRELDRLGFQVHVHGLGDRGVREALDAFEGTDPARRHHVAHLQLVHPDDVPRFAALGVAANIQALWACLDDQMTELTIPFLGEERAGRQYPFGDLHRAGARLVAGSDWPVSTPDPLAAIHTAVHRTAYDDPATGRHRPVPARPGARHRGGVRGVHQRVRLGEPPRRRRSHRAGRGRRPRGARPRSLRDARGDRGRAGAVDVDRRGVRARGLTHRWYVVRDDRADPRRGQRADRHLGRQQHRQGEPRPPGEDQPVHRRRRDVPDGARRATPNDGSQVVRLPNVNAAAARIKVEAVGNYFFDVNHADVAIAASFVVDSSLGDQVVQYSDAPTGTVVITSGTGDSSTLTATASGLPDALVLTRTSASAPGVVPGTATYALTGSLEESTGTSTPVLTFSDGVDSRTVEPELTAAPEDATVTYTGPLAVQEPTSGPTAAALTLTAQVAQVADGTPGDLTTATATFTDTTTDEVLCSVPVPADGAASCDYAGDLPTAGRTLTVEVSIGGNFTGVTSTDTPVVLSVGPRRPGPGPRRT